MINNRIQNKRQSREFSKFSSMFPDSCRNMTYLTWEPGTNSKKKYLKISESLSGRWLLIAANIHRVEVLRAIQNVEKKGQNF